MVLSPKRLPMLGRFLGKVGLGIIATDDPVVHAMSDSIKSAAMRGSATSRDSADFPLQAVTARRGTRYSDST